MAIEVYPAGTLLAHGKQASGYKKSSGRAVLTGLTHRLTLPAKREQILSNADCLDAVICVLADVDFMQGHAVPPGDASTARKESWIWVRQRISQ